MDRGCDVMINSIQFYIRTPNDPNHKFYEHLFASLSPFHSSPQLIPMCGIMVTIIMMTFP